MKIKRDSMGMFDVLKGCLMLIIVYVHHVSFVNGGLYMGDPSAPYVVFTRWSALAVGLFFVIAGYQYRPAPHMKHYIRKRFSQLIFPYLIVILVVAAGRCLVELIHTGGIRLQTASTILVGGLYGSMENVEILGVWAYSVVALWFLPTFFGSGVLFQLLQRIANAKVRRGVIWGLTIVAVYFPDAHHLQLPWFIVQSCAVLGLMEIGRYLREKKVLYRKLPIWFCGAALLLYMFCHMFSGSNIASNLYRFGIIDYAVAAMMSVVVLRCYLRLGAGDWKGVGVLEYIGMYSMPFFLVHGAGLLLIPWEAQLGQWILALPVFSRLPLAVTAGILYIGRCAGILAGCFCLNGLMRLRYRRKRKKEMDA